MIRKGAGQVGWLGIAALLATAARKGDSATECTGGWDCGEVPAAVDVGQCAVETRKPCSLLTQLDLESLRNAEGDMSTAVLFEGCDELPEFARFTRALEKQRLVDVYGSIKTRLAENIAGVWGPDNGPEKFDNLTLSEYIADMRGFLPHHAFNAYDQVNAANVIVKEEGFIINSTGANRELAETTYAKETPHPTIELLQEFKQSILTLSPKGADMPFHQHLSSWLYLAHGRKFWLISEPEISPAPELLWNDLQDVLKIWPEEMAAPSGLRGSLPPVRRCLQPPGSILYLPKDWWHATANIDDCVGIGGHMHPTADEVISSRWLQDVIKKQRAAAAPGQSYGAEEAMMEQRPFQGKHVMTLAKKHYKRKNVKKMVQLMEELTFRVIKTYAAGKLEKDKLQRFIDQYVTEPMVPEVYRMNQSGGRDADVKLLQGYLMSLWADLWNLEPQLSGPTFGPEKLSLRGVFEQWNKYLPPAERTAFPGAKELPGHAGLKGRKGVQQSGRKLSMSEVALLSLALLIFAVAARK